LVSRRGYRTFYVSSYWSSLVRISLLLHLYTRSYPMGHFCCLSLQKRKI
jgi:hypothetical protein